MHTAASVVSFVYEGIIMHSTSVNMTANFTKLGPVPHTLDFLTQEFTLITDVLSVKVSDFNLQTLSMQRTTYSSAGMS